MEEQDSHPAGKMISISRRSFWIFIVCCVMLYVLNKAFIYNPNKREAYLANNEYIWIAAFSGLILNLIMEAMKREETKRKLSVACNIFEITSLIVIILMILIKR